MEKKGRGRPREDNPDVQISKNLSWLLRHGAEKEGLTMDPGGFVLLSEVLQKQFYKSKHVTVEKIREIVATNDKKRYELKVQVNADGKEVLYIRATQGHTLKVINNEYISLTFLIRV